MGERASDRPDAWAARVYHDRASAAAADASVADLIAGRTGVVVLRGLLSADTLGRALAAVTDMEPLARDNSYPNTRLISIGPYLAGALDTVPQYFDAAADLVAMLPPGLAGLQAEVYRMVVTALGLDRLEVAVEGTRDYSPFMVLIHRNDMAMPLHNDMITRDAVGRDLHVAAIRSQLRCTVCLQECTTGGELILYRKPWSAADERFKVAGHFGYPLALVEGCEKLVFKPMTGDVYIFNPTFYHEVAAIAGNTRVTLGFFFGHAGESERDMVAWS